MPILMLFFISILWSFVAVMIKASSVAVDSFTIAFCRFFFGMFFLGLLLLLKGGRISLQLKHRWIWIAVIAKSSSYILENTAISMGSVNASIVELPMQTIFLVLVSFFYFKEELSKRSLAATGLCIAGVLLISWNGLNMTVLFQDSFLVVILYILASIGSAYHMASQKVLIQSMDSANMNFSVFFLSSIITALPVPLNFEWKGSFNFPVLLMLVVLGLITGISFYIYAIALKKISFLISVIITNSCILFTLLWSWLFFNETITVYIMSGAILFLSGIFLLNYREKQFSGKSYKVSERTISRPHG
ncbi:MAG: DMT family transporter [Clostridiales bacterium]|nr:DMT family transporter [Clostridiales bacterium]